MNSSNFLKVVVLLSIFLTSLSAMIATPPTITLENKQTNSSFGYSVASAGDVNGDGYSDISLVSKFQSKTIMVDSHKQK